MTHTLYSMEIIRARNRELVVSENSSISSPTPLLVIVDQNFDQENRVHIYLYSRTHSYIYLSNDRGRTPRTNLIRGSERRVIVGQKSSHPFSHMYAHVYFYLPYVAQYEPRCVRVCVRVRGRTVARAWRRRLYFR